MIEGIGENPMVEPPCKTPPGCHASNCLGCGEQTVTDHKYLSRKCNAKGCQALVYETRIELLEAALREFSEIALDDTLERGDRLQRIVSRIRQLAS